MRFPCHCWKHLRLIFQHLKNSLPVAAATDEKLRFRRCEDFLFLKLRFALAPIPPHHRIFLFF